MGLEMEAVTAQQGRAPRAAGSALPVRGCGQGGQVMQEASQGTSATASTAKSSGRRSESGSNGQFLKIFRLVLIC